MSSTNLLGPFLNTLPYLFYSIYSCLNESMNESRNDLKDKVTIEKIKKHTNQIKIKGDLQSLFLFNCFLVPLKYMQMS